MGAGRKPKARAEKQSESVTATLTPAEMQQLKAKAGREPLGSWVRRLILRSLRRRN